MEEVLMGKIKGKARCEIAVCNGSQLFIPNVDIPNGFWLNPWVELVRVAWKLLVNASPNP